METATFAGVFGAMIGSFLNVVVYRLPRRESLVRPASHCTACGTQIKPYDNIPVVSWLLLRGRCRNCSAPISKRYPLVEALAALLCVGAVLAGGSSATIALNVAFILLLVPIALIDVEHRIIPNRLTALGAILALGIGTALDPSGEPARLIAGAVAGGALLIAAMAYPGGMGMGDVKLAGVMGLFLGSAVAPAMLVALLAGVLFGAADREPPGRAGRTQDRGPVRAVPGLRLACGDLRRRAAGEPVHDPLPELMDAMEPGHTDSEELSLLRPTSIVVDAPPEPPAADTVVIEPAKRKLPSLNASISMSSLKPSRGGRSRGATLVGLDIQPGYVSAVQARVNGSIQVQKAAGAALPPDTMREGEVLDGTALADTLREMFRDSKLDKRVRIGVANQRTVLRTLELPPLTDRKELATAVRFQAEDQVPMPLDNAVLDFHALGVIDTPAGPRQRVIVVAAQRDMVERLIAAVRAAGLRPEGVDLSAFALIRSLHRADEDHSGRVLYLNVGGLTNMAIAEGTVCRFTRVIGGGLESMAADIAERNSIKLTEARELLAAVDLDAAVPGCALALRR